ncbi:TetR family transcriptional regulator [Paracoccus caeni]|uniref:TetR family transcriptional regulator n=1 Tax=Paracoccus caeni TaxID=657651 RepID=A0A934SEY0_9RHOB|nr:TetR/AcrR family transcriptional regulator [Paracoccus caeni]MBK4215741.1 TetR family transcriptional regulator [Paracoccus caeni]
MARPKKIDREQLLDAAEKLVRERGAAALTIDALAKASGITKGGVQYTFSSKDEIIDAMFARWNIGYDQRFDELTGDSLDPERRIRAHITATKEGDETSYTKAASLMAALLQTPENLESTREWYRDRLLGLDLSTLEGRRLWLGFLASEGAFLLHYLRFLPIDEEEWDRTYEDIDRLLDKEF